MSGQQSGVVKRYDENKGFGYITPDDGGQDLFVHFNAFRSSGLKTLAEGQHVSFDVENGPNGALAVNVSAQ
ncbi:cold-shock protein [Pseudomonas sp. microsymbiont 2]